MDSLVQEVTGGHKLMRCTECEAMLDTYLLDKDMSDADRRELKSHIRKCDKCSSLLQVQRALLGEPELRLEAPPAWLDDYARELISSLPATRPRVSLWKRLLAAPQLRVAFVPVAALLLVAVMVVLRPGAPTSLRDVSTPTTQNEVRQLRLWAAKDVSQTLVEAVRAALVFELKTSHVASSNPLDQNTVTELRKAMTAGINHVSPEVQRALCPKGCNATVFALLKPGSTGTATLTIGSANAHGFVESLGEIKLTSHSTEVEVRQLLKNAQLAAKVDDFLARE